MTSEVVHREHLKCRVSIPHLFVIITDRAFSAVHKLASNEIVLSYVEHEELTVGTLQRTNQAVDMKHWLAFS